MKYDGTEKKLRESGIPSMNDIPVRDKKIAEKLGYLAYAYHCADIEKKNEIVAWCKSSFLSAHSNQGIKTIGTFYHRMYNGGTERVISLLLNIWCELGYRVVLFTDEDPNSSDFPYSKSVERIVLPIVTENTKKQYAERIQAWSSALKEFEIDAIIYHAWMSKEKFTDILAIKSNGIPVVMHTHGLFACGMGDGSADFAMDCIFSSKLFNLVDAIITITETDYNWWSMVHPHVYKTINPATFNIENILPASLERKNILYLGRISPEKQIEEMLEILRAVLDAGVTTELDIVGQCEYPSYFKQLQIKIQELKLEQFVNFHGYQTDVEKYYRNCGVYLMTSAFEGMPMTLIESMAFGIPTVMYDLPSVDIVQKGKGIITVPQKDVRGAADAIIALLTNDAKRNKIGTDARASVKEVYSFNISEFWSVVFSELSGNGDAFQRKTPDYGKCKIAVSLLIDFVLKGMELREGNRKRYSSTDPVIVVNEMLTYGDLGFRDIVRFIISWVKCKLGTNE